MKCLPSACTLEFHHYLMYAGKWTAQANTSRREFRIPFYNSLQLCLASKTDELLTYLILILLKEPLKSRTPSLLFQTLLLLTQDRVSNQWRSSKADIFPSSTLPSNLISSGRLWNSLNSNESSSLPRASAPCFRERESPATLTGLGEGREKLIKILKVQKTAEKDE